MYYSIGFMWGSGFKGSLRDNELTMIKDNKQILCPLEMGRLLMFEGFFSPGDSAMVDPVIRLNEIWS